MRKYELVEFLKLYIEKWWVQNADIIIDDIKDGMCDGMFENEEDEEENKD